MNRRLEFAVEERLEAELSKKGVSKIFASWRRTPKNAPTENLFEAFGFDLVRANAGEKKYVLWMPRVDALKHYAEIK